MIESYVLRAQKLATMPQHAFAATYGQVFRVASHLPGSPDSNVHAIWEMHQRHGREIVEVIDAELLANASLAALSELPPTSLLAMIISPVAQQPPYVDPVETEPPAAVQAAADTHNYTWRGIAFGVDPKARRIVFENGIELGGSVYELIGALVETFESELNAGATPSHHKFVKAEALAKRLKIEEQSLRQRISRTRKRIAESFQLAIGRELGEDDIVENQSWAGYRLNPHLLMVKPAQLRKPGPLMSQRPSGDVTSRSVTR